MIAGCGNTIAKTIPVLAFGSVHASTALNAAVVAVVGPVALCVDAAVDVPVVVAAVVVVGDMPLV